MTECDGWGVEAGVVATAFSSRRIMRLKKTWIISDRSPRDEVVPLLAGGGVCDKLQTEENAEFVDENRRVKIKVLCHSCIIVRGKTIIICGPLPP